jgi:hypothetical protein
MDQMNFSQLLSAVAELRGQLVSILITGREDVSEPVAVLIGTAGTVDMSGDSDSEESRSSRSRRSLPLAWAGRAYT